MDATAALAELKDLSTQIEVVVLAYRSGEVKASTAGGAAAERLGKLGAEIVEHADQVRRDLGRDGVSQLQVATPDGSLFIVLDSNLMALATTAPDPTAGLVFYDLKTLLRQIDEPADEPTPEPEAEPAEEADDADDTASVEEGEDA
jgi:predicted regulator of Ras-like GTPase activity (Roadblock/LC7/MglB family)